MRRVVSLWLADFPSGAPARKASLRAIALWCLRYAPLVGLDPPDGIAIDITGSAHLFGGEAALLSDLRARLSARGFTTRAAIAPTPGAARALARFGSAEEIIVPPDGLTRALDPLPPAALGLSEEASRLAARLGIGCIAALAALPRGPLARRFGEAVLDRLDQVLGRAQEPISPLAPPAPLAARLAFAEPLGDAGALTGAISRLVATLSRILERAGQGARRLDLTFERIDQSIGAIQVGTARPTRNARHLSRLLLLHLEEIDPEPGIATIALTAPLAEPIVPGETPAIFAGGRSAAGGWSAARAETPDLAMLIDRLANRFGPARLYGTAAVESDVPERSVRRLSPLAPEAAEKAWPSGLPRPVRLFSPPEPVSALALLPDHPPAQFVWRGRRHRLSAGDGPERIFGEWWKRDSEFFAVRDYFRVEDTAGRRFWLFRRGDGADPATGDGCWFLHGFF